MSPSLDVIAIGNAIVDVLGHVDDAFLAAHDIPKGEMRLIDTERAVAITEALDATETMAGGSAGNSMAVLAGLGGKAGFIGKTADDALGAAYKASMEEVGVRYLADPLPASDPTSTGRCLIAVTPDAERSMSTFLGAAGMVTDADIDPTLIADTAIVFFEGYLFDAPGPRAAFAKAAPVARAAGRKTALTVSDVGVIERNRDALVEMIRDHVDILFANAAEAEALFGAHDDPKDLAAAMAQMVEVGVVTRSEHGSMVFGPDTAATTVPAFAPDQLVDTTGAGDAFAGGFFYGFTRDMPLARCAQIGSMAATEVISHMGARAKADLTAYGKTLGVL